MGVFDNYIGIKGLSTTPSRSGLYVNQLSGIEVKTLKKLAKSEVPSVLEWYDDLYAMSVNGLINDIQIRLNEDFYAEKILGSVTTGQLKVTNEQASLGGVLIDTYVSKYSEIEIENITLFVDTLPSPAIINIDVYDGVSGQLIDTITENISLGLNTFSYYGRKYENQSLLFNHDAVLRATEDSDFMNGLSYNIVSGGGLIVTANKKCSVRKFLEKRLSLFAQALLYRIGQDLMLEAITSQNSNCLTGTDIDTNTKLMNFYKDEKERILDGVLKHQHIKDDAMCFRCRGKVMAKVNLP
jgi:hypothetical protein